MDASRIELESGNTPSSFPPAGFRSIYVKTDGWYSQDETGAETKFATAAEIVEDAINDGVTNKAPSENAVYDAIQTLNADIALKQDHDPTLDALAAYNTNGILVQTAHDVFAGRTLTPGAGISITNGDGVAGNPTVACTITQYTDEMAQDAIGGALLATTSVNPTYNDAANQFSWDVLPGGVNHNLLFNYVASQHVDHTSVNISGASNGGLGGGGTIAASRTMNIDWTNLIALTVPADRLATDDLIAVYDTSAATHKKITLKDFLAQRRSFIDQSYVEADDFIKDQLGGLTGVGAGTGNSTQIGTYGHDTTENAIGISQTDTGTTATGRRLVSSELGALMSTLARYRFGTRIAIEQLSTILDTFTVYIGFQDTSASGNPTNGAFFRYTNGTNGGRWEAVTNKTGGTLTAIDTGVAADVLYSIFEIEIAADGASVKFYINGALVATATTNIPVAASNQTFGYGWKIEKSLGITQMNLSADWYYFEMERSSAR